MKQYVKQPLLFNLKAVHQLVLKFNWTNHV